MPNCLRARFLGAFILPQRLHTTHTSFSRYTLNKNNNDKKTKQINKREREREVCWEEKHRDDDDEEGEEKKKKQEEEEPDRVAATYITQENFKHLFMYTVHISVTWSLQIHFSVSTTSCNSANFFLFLFFRLMLYLYLCIKKICLLPGCVCFHSDKKEKNLIRRNVVSIPVDFFNIRFIYFLSESSTFFFICILYFFFFFWATGTNWFHSYVRHETRLFPAVSI